MRPRSLQPVGPVAGPKSVPVGTTAAFEILSIDLAQKRIGVALVAGRIRTGRWCDGTYRRTRARARS